jgi:cytidylate kinase
VDPIIITIDGGAATGTSSLAKALSKHLGIPYMNTGELYRSVAFLARQQGLDFDSPTAMAAIAEMIDFKFHDGTVIALNGQPVSQEDLRSVSDIVERVSPHPDVRKHIQGWQTRFAQINNCVLEGRDLGSTVFPNAAFKVFLTCEDTERAKRRSNHEGRVVTVDEILKRDRADAERDHSPMVCPAEAHRFDTTHTSTPELVGMVERLLMDMPDVWARLKG